MKHIAAIIFIVFSTLSLHSQTYEIGGFIGGANFIGDVGKSNYLYPKNLAFGGIAKWNRSSRHSFRATIITTKLTGDDADSHETRRQERGFTFENGMTEISLGLEYTFWEFNMYTGNRVSTPYLYTGVTYLFYDALRLNQTSGEIIKYGTTSDFAIPMVVGYKASIGTNSVAAFEIGARYALSDALDGNVAPRDEYIDSHFGDTNNNDWYVFTGITFTFTFGRKPCYCNF